MSKYTHKNIALNKHLKLIYLFVVKPQTPTASTNSPVIETKEAILRCHSDPLHSGTITYSWRRHDGRPVTGSQNPTAGTLTFSSVSQSDAGYYICTASNVAGDMDSVPVQLVVYYCMCDNNNTT